MRREGAHVPLRSCFVCEKLCEEAPARVAVLQEAPTGRVVLPEIQRAQAGNFVNPRGGN
jgi:hypothetical protein